MKNHFIYLFNKENLRKTIILVAIGALLISASLIIGTSDNIPMIVMLFAGIILLSSAILRPWKKASYFAILTAVCFVILAMDFIWPFINEGIAMSVGFVCFAGIITGIIGIFTRIKNWRRLPFAGSLLSLVALGMLITSVPIPLTGIITPGNEWILIGLQVFVTILLFFIGLLNKRERWSTKGLLIVAALMLILMAAWGFYASTLEFGEEVHSKGAAILFCRIYASTDIIIAALSLYACK
jgi:hypothetical protein